jgi:pimeloyl-ACP methyl ester carboxylesterase
MPRSPQPLDLDTLVDGVADRLTERVDLLVGHSLGAIVALALVSRQPEAARALVLEDPPGRGDGDPGAFADGIAADAAIVRHDREQLVRREREANPHWAPEDVEQAVNGIAAADAPSIVAGLRGPLRWDLPALLAGARVPVLVVAAPEEPGGFLGSATALRGADRKAIQAQLPADRFVVLEGGHCLHRDDPGRWLEVVESFATDALALPGRLPAV